MPSLELRAEAPNELHDITIEGEALASLTSVATGNDLRVAWPAGEAGDLVYVEVIGGTDARSLGVCAFRDADGSGTLPSGLFGATGSGGLTFHRLRDVTAEVPKLDGAEVRFDFALAADLAFR